MGALSAWVVPVTALAGLLALCVVVWVALRQRAKAPAEPRHAPGTIEMLCTVCQRALTFTRNDLIRLEGVEIALTIRVHPELSGRPLGEYACPYCEALHCFTLDGRKPTWVGANLYVPQNKGALCAECRKPLVRPPWSKGEYDGRLRESPGLKPDHGLVCPFCGSTCCVACCHDVTRNRTKDGSYICPRCHRSPVDRVFHP